MRALLGILLLAGGWCGAQAQELYEWRDDFAAATPTPAGWEADPMVWTVRDGALAGDWVESAMAVVQHPYVYRELTAEVTAVPQAVRGKNWKITALAVVRDERNYWHLGLVEKPDANTDEPKQHYVELSEMRDGNWVAQGNLRSRVHEGGAFDWQYGQPYRLAITLDAKGIEGTVTDAAGKVQSRMGYDFNAPAVDSGRPGLRVTAAAARFDDVRVRGALAGREAVPVQPPPEQRTFPAYAGPASGIRTADGRATGFFRLEQAGETAWLVDPRGERFYAVGTDHVNYHAHWCQKLGYAPYNRNCEATYGSIEAWAQVAAKRLREWGFNLLGAGNVEAVRYKGLAHTLFVSFGATFAGSSALVERTTWTGFPNVFDPKWEAFCRYHARRACAPNRNDPWVLGYFLDNELEWYGKGGGEAGILIETMKWPADHSGKRAWVDLLRTRHGSLEAFNQAWNLQVKTWDEVLALTALPAATTDAARQAQSAFLERVAERYFAVTAAAVREADPNHLVIGSRFAGDAPLWAWQACARHCDVVTFNHYPWIDFESGDLRPVEATYREYFGRVHKPMMVTEWSFPALDAGLPSQHGAGMRVDTQTQKTRCFELMQHLFFRLPFMVGSDYFMWVDEPAEGISDTFPEDSNYGLVNVHDQPYPELTATCTRLNPLAMRIHAGEAGAYDLRVPRLEAAAGIPLAERPDLLRSAWPQGLGTPRWPVRVANPGGRAATDVPVLLGPLPTAPGYTFVPAAGGEPLPVATAAGDLVLRLPQLAAGAEAVGFVYPRPAAAAGDRQKLRCERVGAKGFVVSNGVLRLEHDGTSGNCVDRVYLGDLLLGAYNPLVWQCPGQNQWTQPSRLESVTVTEGDGALALDIVAASGEGGPAITAVDDNGRQAQRQGRGTAFEVTHRLLLWPGVPYFTARAVQVRNTDAAQPLVVKALFFYLTSAIGGSRDGDETAGNGVPNYYRSNRVAAWHDATAGGRYGCMPLSAEVKANFWADPGGMQHPDARRELETAVELAPGQTYTVPPQDRLAVLVFGATGSATGPASWADLEARLWTWSRLQVEQGPSQARP